MGNNRGRCAHVRTSYVEMNITFSTDKPHNLRMNADRGHIGVFAFGIAVAASVLYLEASCTQAPGELCASRYAH